MEHTGSPKYDFYCMTPFRITPMCETSRDQGSQKTWLSFIEQNIYLRITFIEERGHGIVTEQMDGSLEEHLKDKLTIFKKIRDRTATREEETSFMYVPIRNMTNWLRKAFYKIAII